MRPLFDTARRVGAAPLRALAQGLAGFLALCAWGYLSFRACAFLGEPRWIYLPAAWSALSVGAALGIVAAARRWPGLRGVVAFALLMSVPLLPWLHGPTLDWLSLVHVGGFGDFVWGLRPGDFYPLRDRNFETSVACSAAFFAVPLAFAALMLAALRRRALRRVAIGAAVALVTGLTALACFHLATRPPLARWLDAFPVVARVRSDDVPANTSGRTLLVPSTRVELSRAVAPNGEEVVFSRAPAISDGDGHPLPPDSRPLDCRAGATLVLRRVPEDNLLLLSCGEPPASRWDGAEYESRPAPAVEVHYWEIKLRNLHLLRYTAPPPSWVATAVAGLALALALARRRRAVQPSAIVSPYRTPATREATPAGDDAYRAVLDAAAIATAVHAAAPLALVAWVRLL